MNNKLEDQRGTVSGTTLATSLTARIRRAIVSGQLEPNERLPLDRLREQFGVSLSPLREALSRLSSEGFVLIEDQKGYRVSPMSEENQQHVTQMRSHFEIYALRESIAKGTIAWESEVTAAHYILNRIDRKTVEDIEIWEEAHRDFHFKLISACGIPLLLQFCMALHDHSDRYRRAYLLLNRGDKGIPAEHKLIAEAALTRQTDLACETLRKHIERAGKNARKAVHMMAHSDGKHPVRKTPSLV